MFAKIQLLALAGSFVAVSAGVADDKPTIQPNTPYDQVEQGLRDHLSPTHSNWDYWGSGWIPKACKDYANGKGLSPWDFTVFNVHYDDCSDAWTFCRHKDSAGSEIDMIDMFGRMPVHMRSYIRQFIATPYLNDGIAGLWMYPGDVAVAVAPSANLLAHEFSHSLDFLALQQYGFPFSSTDIWNSNYAQDSAVPSDYSRTNFVENFAEVGVIGLYDKVVPGGIGNIQPNWGAIFHQYATYQGYLGDNILPGGSCRNRIGNSETVQMGGSSKMRRALGPKPDTSFKNSTINIIEPDSKFEGVVYVTPTNIHQ